jgi:hypothetical protein
VIANDVTLTQTTGGGSARAIAVPGNPVTGGRLAALPPPSGVGVYDGGGGSLNIAALTDLANTAWWMTHVGTVDEHRLPGIVIDLGNAGLSVTLAEQVAALDLGWRLTIADPPSWLTPDAISQLAADITEELWTDRRILTITGIPSSPYHVAQERATTAHADPGTSTTLSTGYSSGATSLVVNLTGLLWSVSGADYPVDINVAGERMTVTAVSGSGPLTQTMTVTRGVNGVSKAQASGAVVVLWDTPVAAL